MDDTIEKIAQEISEMDYDDQCIAIAASLFCLNKNLKNIANVSTSCKTSIKDGLSQALTSIKNADSKTCN